MNVIACVAYRGEILEGVEYAPGDTNLTDAIARALRAAGAVGDRKPIFTLSFEGEDNTTITYTEGTTS